MTRSEEQLQVGKYVVSENVTKTVPVSKERAVVESEPITDANIDEATDGPAISEEEHEVTLTEERPSSRRP
jgi:stress response protein YsnF